MQSAAFGHKGSSSLNPCLHCLITLEQLHSGVTGCENRILEAMKVNQHSIECDPMFKITSLDQVIPPALHLILGLGNGVLKALMKAVGEEDIKSFCKDFLNFLFLNFLNFLNDSSGIKKFFT